MDSYADNEAAFAAWGEILAFRKEYRAKLQAETENAAQKAAEIDKSKRNLLTRWL
jgi:ABC-type Fe3+-citrate transport system substrate-binding protein